MNLAPAQSERGQKNGKLIGECEQFGGSSDKGDVEKTERG